MPEKSISHKQKKNGAASACCQALLFRVFVLQLQKTNIFLFELSVFDFVSLISMASVAELQESRPWHGTLPRLPSPSPVCSQISVCLKSTKRPDRLRQCRWSRKPIAFQPVLFFFSVLCIMWQLGIWTLLLVVQRASCDAFVESFFTCRLNKVNPNCSSGCMNDMPTAEEVSGICY